MANSAYGSGINLDALMVPTKAATIFAAHENSLFLGGQLIPSITVAAGSASAQVPVMGSVTATKISAEATPGADLDTVLPADTKNTIALELHAARSVIRDLGTVDPNEIGRVLGNSVSAKFDTDVAAQLEAAGITQEVDTDGALTLDHLFDAVGAIRGNGEMGQLFAVLSPSMATNLMKAIGAQAYAGGEFQTEALRNGFIGRAAGINLFQSSYMTAGSGTVFGADAFRYYLLADMPVGQDTSFTRERFIVRYNSDLANNVGNLANRVLKLIAATTGGKIPAQRELWDIDRDFQREILDTIPLVEQIVSDLRIHTAIDAIIRAVKTCNHYLETTEPWTLKKDTAQRERLETILYTALEGLRIISGLLFPVIPDKMAILRQALGLEDASIVPDIERLNTWGLSVPGESITPIQALFPRVE